MPARSKSPTPRFAEKTEVDPVKSRMEIDRLLRRFGVDGSAIGQQNGHPFVQFTIESAAYRFVLPSPIETVRMPQRYRGSIEDARRRAVEQEERRLWRALTMVIKAKIEIIETGISDTKRELLPYLVREDGMTVGEAYSDPRFAPAITGGVQLALPAPPS